MSWRDLRFAVDSAGRPWFAHDGNSLVYPLKAQSYALAKPLRDIAALSRKMLFLCTDEDLGFIPRLNEFETTEDGLPLLPYQPIVELPIKDCRLFPGEGDALYVLGRDPDSPEFQVYALSLGQKANPRTWNLVFAGTEEISAVAGNGFKTYVAIGKHVFEVDQARKAVKSAFSHPREAIADLAYSKRAGLFYATQSAVGFAGPGAGMEFLKASGSRVQARGDSLYVLLVESLGVLKLSGVDEFRISAAKEGH